MGAGSHPYFFYNRATGLGTDTAKFLTVVVLLLKTLNVAFEYSTILFNTHNQGGVG